MVKNTHKSRTSAESRLKYWPKPPQTPANTLSSLVLTKRFKAVYITTYLFKVRQAVQICKENKYHREPSLMVVQRRILYFFE